MFVERAMTEQLISIIKFWYVKVKAMESNTRHSVITPEEVSRKLNIWIEKVKDNLRVTTQKGIRNVLHPLHHIYRVDNTQLNRKRINPQFYTDHLLEKN